MKKIVFWFGKVLAAILAGAAAALLIGVSQVHMLPNDILIAVGILMALLAAMVLVLTW